MQQQQQQLLRVRVCVYVVYVSYVCIKKVCVFGTHAATIAVYIKQQQWPRSLPLALCTVLFLSGVTRKDKTITDSEKVNAHMLAGMNVCQP